MCDERKLDNLIALHLPGCVVDVKYANVYQMIGPVYGYYTFDGLPPSPIVTRTRPPTLSLTNLTNNMRTRFDISDCVAPSPIGPGKPYQAPLTKCVQDTPRTNFAFVPHLRSVFIDLRSADLEGMTVEERIEAVAPSVARKARSRHDSAVALAIEPIMTPTAISCSSIAEDDIDSANSSDAGTHTTAPGADAIAAQVELDGDDAAGELLLERRLMVESGSADEDDALDTPASQFHASAKLSVLEVCWRCHSIADMLGRSRSGDCRSPFVLASAHARCSLVRLPVSCLPAVLFDLTHLCRRRPILSQCISLSMSRARETCVYALQAYCMGGMDSAIGRLDRRSIAWRPGHRERRGCLSDRRSRRSRKANASVGDIEHSVCI